MKKPGRVRGSCRFEAYYQVQLWDSVRMVWTSGKQNSNSPEAAAALVKPGARYRVVIVAESGRTFGEARVKE